SYSREISPRNLGDGIGQFLKPGVVRMPAVPQGNALIEMEFVEIVRLETPHSLIVRDYRLRDGFPIATKLVMFGRRSGGKSLYAVPARPFPESVKNLGALLFREYPVPPELPYIGVVIGVPAKPSEKAGLHRPRVKEGCDERLSKAEVRVDGFCIAPSFQKV